MSEPIKKAPGWDAKVIAQIAKEKYGGFREMFEAHDWPERGSDMMRSVQRRVAETYGSVDGFVEADHPRKAAPC